MGIQVRTVLSGVVNGYNFTSVNRKEAEIIQGGNYYFASVLSFPRAAVIGNIFQRVLESAFQTPSSFSVKLFSNSVPFLALPFALLCANVKHGHYSQLLDFLDEGGFRVARFLPRTLSERTIRIFHFFSENMGSLSLSIMTVQSLALIYFGQASLGAGILSMIFYEEANKRGYIPHRVRLFEQTYAPKLATISSLLDFKSILITRAVSFASSLTLSPLITKFVSHKLDLVLLHYLPLEGFSLEEYEAPLVERRNMNKSQIDEILTGKDDNYELNPAHCSKLAVDPPEDHQFDYLLTLFDQYDWNTESEYRVIVGKLKEDRRFLDFLGKKFPEENIEEKFDNLIDQLAKSAGKSMQVYVSDWARAQLSLFVQSLKGEIIPEGTPVDLSDAISNSAKVVHYLKSSVDEIEKTDLLLKMAIEGGFYCSRGMKRASKEIVENTVMPNTLYQGADPTKIYETKTLITLQECRRSLVDRIYHAITNENLPQVISEDPHNFDLYQTILTFGFYPISTFERQNIGIAQTFTWRAYSFIRANMEQSYRENLYDTMEQKRDTVHFVNYIRLLIGSNSSLTEREKNTLTERLASPDVDMDSFRRLMLVTIGVLRKKKNLA